MGRVTVNNQFLTFIAHGTLPMNSSTSDKFPEEFESLLSNLTEIAPAVASLTAKFEIETANAFLLFSRLIEDKNRSEISCLRDKMKEMVEHLNTVGDCINTLYDLEAAFNEALYKVQIDREDMLVSLSQASTVIQEENDISEFMEEAEKMHNDKI